MFFHFLLTVVVVNGNILDPTQKGPYKPVAPVKPINQSGTDELRQNFMTLKTGEQRKLCSKFIEAEEKSETNQKKIYRNKKFIIDL